MITPINVATVDLSKKLPAIQVALITTLENHKLIEIADIENENEVMGSMQPQIQVAEIEIETGIVEMVETIEIVETLVVMVVEEIESMKKEAGSGAQREAEIAIAVETIIEGETVIEIGVLLEMVGNGLLRMVVVVVERRGASGRAPLPEAAVVVAVAVAVGIEMRLLLKQPVEATVPLLENHKITSKDHGATLDSNLK